MSTHFYELNSEVPGFTGVWNYGEWKLAIMNDAPNLRVEALVSMSRHLNTDEAFALLDGEASIYIGDGTDDIGVVTRHFFDKGRVYVVPKNTWHQLRTESGAKLMIVEQSDTGAENSVTVPVKSSVFDH